MTIGDLAIIAYTFALWAMMFIALVFFVVVLMTWAQDYNHCRRIAQMKSWDMTGRRVVPFRRR